MIGNKLCPPMRISRRQLCCVCGLVVTFAIGLVIAYAKLYNAPTILSSYQRSLPELGENARSGGQPFLDFINPDFRNILRMFHICQTEKPFQHAAKQNSMTLQVQPSPQANVTVFETNEKVHYNACVPFHGVVNRTLKICVYESQTDQVISANIRNKGLWEKRYVDDLVFLLRHDKYTRDKDFTRVGSNKIVGSKRDINSNIMVTSTKQKPNKRNLQREREKASFSKERTSENFTPDTSRPTPDELEKSLSVVDIGCNVGVYTLAAASLGHPVLAVDPLQYNLRLLTTSLSVNELTSLVTLLLNAIADKPGPMNLAVNAAGNIGGSSVYNRQKENQGQPVWAVCLNDIVPWVPTRRVFLKMDIEGWEEHVLRCAGYFFQQVDVQYVQMEWVFHRKLGRGRRIIDFMIKNGMLPYARVIDTVTLDMERYYEWPIDVLWKKR